MDQTPASSPHWSSTTKLLTGFIIVGIVAFLLYRFSNLITPLLMIVVLVYLLHPITSALSRSTGLSWKVSVNLLFLVIVLSLGGLLTWGGVGLVQQIQSLIRSVQDIINNLPEYLEQFSTLAFTFGPFTLDMQTVNIEALSQQVLSIVQPLLGQTGNLVGALASGAAGVFGWTVFVLIVSYFIMIESSGLRAELFKVDVPGYTADIERLSTELSRLWNAFLRGQIIVFALAVAIYSIVLPVMGVRYALGIALMAGLAKFLPYIGPAITWIVMALVTYFQANHPFGLSPLAYMAMVVISTSIIDWVIDTFITPRIMASTLKVHPAAILITAIIAANLLGLLGVVIAAPFLASVTLLGRYVMRKMFDLDPWPEKPVEHPPVGSEWLKRLRGFFTRNQEQVREVEALASSSNETVRENNIPDRAETAGMKSPRKISKRSKKNPKPKQERT